MHRTPSSLTALATTPKLVAAAAAVLLLAAAPQVRAQQFYSSSGSLSTGPVNVFPINNAVAVQNWSPNQLYVGNAALGSFSALAGAQLTAGALVAGTGGNGIGTISITGPGTLVNVDGTNMNRLDVGSWGVGAMTVQGGAIVDASVNGGAAGCGTGCYSFIGNAAGSTANLTITGAGSELRTLRNFTVGQTSVFTSPPNASTFGTPGGITTATVDVQAGGKLATEGGVIGSNNGSPNGNGLEQANGTVNISGSSPVTSAGSQWVVKHNSVDNAATGVTVGRNVGGTGNLTISAGGSMLVDATNGLATANDFINLGQNGGKGTLTVTGAGSSLTLARGGAIQAGRSNSAGGTQGDGSFSVLAGASVSATFLNVGRDGSKGTVTIDGATSQLLLSGLGVYTGGAIGPAGGIIGWNGGTGTMTVSNGALWRVSDGGANTSTGPGSPFIDVGISGGNGTLSIKSNARVEMVTTSINPAAGVADNYNPYMVVGRDASTGTLTIDTGGKLLLTGSAVSTQQFSRGTSFYVGGDSDTAVGGNGTATVTGPGSEIRVTGTDGFIAVGRNGTGSLSLSNQALVETMIINVGRGTTATSVGDGTLLMNNSTLLLNGQQTGSNLSGAGMSIGNRGGTGRATIDNGSVVTITNLGSAGAGLNLGGTGPNPLGDGTLTLSGGSRIDIVTAPGLGFASIGRDGRGDATLSGASTIDVGTGGIVHVGRLATGSGTLNVESGSKLLAGEFYLGGSSDTVAGGIASASVTGAGSEIAARSDLGRIAVGRFGGTATLDVTDQGKLSAKVLTIGRAGTGYFNADGAVIDLAGDQFAGGTFFGAGLAVGNRGGSGTAAINNSTVDITNNSTTGAWLNVGGVSTNPQGSGTLALTGGTKVNINAAQGLGEFNVGYDGSAVALIDGPGTVVNVNNGGSVYVARLPGSTGTLVLSNGAVLNAGFVGVGVQQPGTTRDTTGPTGGTGVLVLNDSTIIATQRFELGAGSLLMGNNGVIRVTDTVDPINGLVKGPVVIAGTISPGNSPGRIRIECDVTMLAGSRLILEINQTGVDNFEIDQLVIGSDSNFDLKQLQIVFSFMGDTDPNAFAATPGGFNLDKFLKAGNGTDESAGLSTLFERNGYDNWNDVVGADAFAFQSDVFDVTQVRFNPETGRIGIVAEPIPEPASVALVLLALAAMRLAQRRRMARRV